jgi:UDP-N-acetyl-D-galactosamine dehydrogenase
MHNSRVAVIGLDRFGLSLAARLARSCSVIGFDTDSRRVNELYGDTSAIVPMMDRGKLLQRNGGVLQKGLLLTHDPDTLAEVNLYVIIVSDAHDRLLKATSCVGVVLDHGDTVIFEPGFMQQASFHTCLTLLEEHSGLSCWNDFSVGFIDRLNQSIADGGGQLAKRCGIVAAAAVYRRYRSKLCVCRGQGLLHANLKDR